jgi:hypothetical protein
MGECMWGVLGFIKEYSATIIALCAIALTIQQSLALRKHNRLSIRPMLALTSNRQNHPDVVVFESFLSNNGLGPAYIKSFHYLIDGSPVNAETTEQVYEAIEKSAELNIVTWSFTLLKPKHVMGKDTSEKLFLLTLLANSKVTLEELERYQIKVVYESAYGEEFIYDSRDHK